MLNMMNYFVLGMGLEGVLKRQNARNLRIVYCVYLHRCLLRS